MAGQAVDRPHGSTPIVGLFLVAGVVVAGVLSLSDRAPHAVVRLAFRLDVADEIERASFGVDPFLFGHAALWGTLAVLLLVTLRGLRRRYLLVALVGLVAASVAVEEAQRRLTASRGFEAQDIAANAVGVLGAWLVVEALAALQRAATAPG